MAVSLLEPFITIVVLLYKKIKFGLGKIWIRPKIYRPYPVYRRPTVEFYEEYTKMPKKQFFFNFGDVFLRGEVSVQLFIKIVGEKFFGLVSPRSSFQKRAGA